MPIPAFDHNHVLPPHIGNPTQQAELSPYPCTILELCQRFATSNHRIAILKNFILFRQRLTAEGVVNGFQWLDGSFMSNIEHLEGRSPNDLDLVTLYTGLSLPEQAAIVANFPEFVDSARSKAIYQLDHYPFDCSYSPDLTVEKTRYWIQLFTHDRNGVWKGMLKLPLNTPAEDNIAMDYLNSI